MPSTTATIAVSASSLAISAGAEDRHVNSSTSNTSPTKDDASTRPTFSHMTYSRAWLKQVALDNCAIAEKGSYVNPENNQVVNITKAFDQAMKGSIHYHSSHTFEPPPDSSRNQYSTTFIIANGSSSMQVASQLLKMQQSNDARDDETNSDDSQANSEDSQKTHIGVLNSASGKTPGGKFFRGTVSQEDQICRSSLLYPCLKQFDDRPHHFYFVNQKPKYRNSASACAIFSPHVPVIRQDSVRASLLAEPLHQISFCSIPAPNAFVVGPAKLEQDEEKTKRLIPKAQSPGQGDLGIPHEHISLWDSMHDRLFRVLSIFHQHACQDLVLCAFGCGVHGNNPDSVAQILHELLTGPFEGCFRNVAFSVAKARPANFQSFSTHFPEATVWENTEDVV